MKKRRASSLTWVVTAVVVGMLFGPRLVFAADDGGGDCTARCEQENCSGADCGQGHDACDEDCVRRCDDGTYF